MQQKLFSGSGFYIGQMFHEAAARHGAVPVVLDRPLDVAPGTGLRHTYRSLADLVGRLADQLWAAGVRPASHVAIHKRDNADIALLGCAASRIGAVPVLLSPGLDPTAAGILLGRLDRPLLVTDDTTLARLKGHTDITSKCVLVSELGDLEVTQRARPVRLHPDKPYFVYSPPVLGEFAITPDQPYRARYRLMIHDGLPDAALLDRLAADLAAPMVATPE